MPTKQRKRTDGPTAADYQRAAPELRECPHCWRWGVVPGYVCNACDKDPQGQAREQGEPA